MKKSMELLMAKVSEKIETKKVTDIELLTESVAALTIAVQTQNAIIMCLLHKFNIETDLPTWQDKEIFEKEMAAKVDACDKAIRKIYERSKTDKS